MANTKQLDEFRLPGEDETGLALQKDWTKEEETRAKRKLDLIIMPLLTLGFFCLRKRKMTSV